MMLKNNVYLGWLDYLMLIIFLGLSLSIGIWYGCFGNKQKTNKDFLIAGGKMNILPTAISLFASLCSASTMLGIPLEIYYYGTVYLYFIFSWLIASFVTSEIFIPKFRELGLISIYTYLENRFSLLLRICVTLTYILSNILFMSVLLYAPCLALSQVTGLDLWFSIISCGLICTLYTSIGGMKAVIWSDVVQSFVMFSGVLLTIIYGFIDVGGIKSVYEKSISGERIKLVNLSIDPSERYTIWSVLIGGTFYAISCSCVLQTQVQRYMCVKTTRDAKKATWINNILVVLLITLCGIVGLLIYTKYADCDPLKAKRVSRSDQFYPLFVMETLSRFPGLPGLFISSVMSGSLSSISSGVNSIAAVIIEDVWKCLKGNKCLSDEFKTKISKYISVLLGLLTILLSFLMSYLTNILVIAYSIMGTLPAPILGVFLLGFFFPRVNNRSALIGYISSLIFQVWILIGANLTRHQQSKKILPISIDGCIILFNQTNPTINSTNIGSNNVNNFFLPLYSISFMWYSFNGVILTIIIGLVASLFWNNSKSDIDKIDPSLFISYQQIFSCCSSKKNSLKSSQKTLSNNDTIKDNNRKDDNNIEKSPEEIELMTISPS